MAGSGGDAVVPVSPRARQPRGAPWRHKAAATCLPLDVIVEEIAARSDAATLVRCAATCRDARRRIAEDPNLRARLRLRDTGRFVLPLLRGHLVGIDINYGYGNMKTDVYLMDATATHLVKKATLAETLTNAVPVDSRGSLVLVRATTTSEAHPWQRQHDHLRVCEFPSHTGHTPDVQYVLLVGDSDGKGGTAVGRPFKVLKAKLLQSTINPLYRCLMVHTFSSEHGTWSRLTEIPTPSIHGRYICWASRRNVLVIGDVVHWLCLTDVGSYMIICPDPPRHSAICPRGDTPGSSYLLAMDSARSPVVLVADAEDKNIRVWEQCKLTMTKMMWKAQPHVVIEKEGIQGFNDEVKEVVLRFNDEMVKIFRRKEGTTRMRTMCGPELLWFGETSGAVLLRIHGCCLLLLDLHSKKILRCFSNSLDCRRSNPQIYCPYEMDLSSWVPTFSNVITI